MRSAVYSYDDDIPTYWTVPADVTKRESEILAEAQGLDERESNLQGVPGDFCSGGSCCKPTLQYNPGVLRARNHNHPLVDPQASMMSTNQAQ